MRYGLSEKQIEEIISFIQGYPAVAEAVLFGSRALGTFKEASDVDIAIKGDKVTAGLAATMKFDIEEDSFLPFFFDVIAYPAITNEALKRHIDTKGVVLWRRDGGENGTMSGWREFKLDDLAVIQNHKRIPLSSMERSKRQGVFPYYGASGIVDYIDSFIFDGEHVLISEDGENLRTRKTPIAFRAKGKFWVNNHAHIVKCKESYLDKLICYYLQNIDLNEFISGAVQPKLTKHSLTSIPFYLPESKDEQRAIAAVLSSLDDKIDLLHRQNKTLEAMAETLFRQWFVEEAGEDWEERPLSGIANFLNGLACQKYPPQNDTERLPVLKIKELGSGISESSDWASSKVNPEYIVETGDVIFSWSASLMVKLWDGGKCILNQHLFKVTSAEFPKWYYLLWCKHHLSEFIAISASHATTMGHIKRGDLDTAMVTVPLDNELAAMNEQMVPLLDKQIAIAKQVQTLQRLRDTLLPRLMSGEVRVTY